MLPDQECLWSSAQISRYVYVFKECNPVPDNGRICCRRSSSGDPAKGDSGRRGAKSYYCTISHLLFDSKKTISSVGSRFELCGQEWAAEYDVKPACLSALLASYPYFSSLLRVERVSRRCRRFFEGIAKMRNPIVDPGKGGRGKRAAPGVELGQERSFLKILPLYSTQRSQPSA